VGPIPTTIAPSLRRHLGDARGASIYIVAKRQKDKLKDEAAPLQDIGTGAPAPEGPAEQFALWRLQRRHEYSKGKLETSQWMHQKDNYRKWFQISRGYPRSAPPRCGKRSDVGPGQQAPADLPAGGANAVWATRAASAKATRSC
jgi:hypothetical protein